MRGHTKFGAVGGFKIRVRVSGPKFDFFLLGLRLGHVMICDVALACANVRSVMQINNYAMILPNLPSHC